MEKRVVLPKRNSCNSKGHYATSLIELEGLRTHYKSQKLYSVTFLQEFSLAHTLASIIQLRRAICVLFRTFIAQ